MSYMKCHVCHDLIDTDSDPDSLYVFPDECVCEACRETYHLKTEWEREEERPKP